MISPTDIEADEEIELDASNVDNYCCFADIDWMQEQPVNARVTVANVIADEDNSSWGGWVLILVYADALEPMRNLTVFDGLAMITSGWGGGGDNSTVDVDISGVPHAATVDRWTSSSAWWPTTETARMATNSGSMAQAVSSTSPTPPTPSTTPSTAPTAREAP